MTRRPSSGRALCASLPVPGGSWQALELLCLWMHRPTLCFRIHMPLPRPVSDLHLLSVASAIGFRTCPVTFMLLFRHQVVSYSLWPCGLKHARLLWRPLSPGVCSNSYPLSRWCHLTISSSVPPSPFTYSLTPASGSFLKDSKSRIILRQDPYLSYICKDPLFWHSQAPGIRTPVAHFREHNLCPCLPPPSFTYSLLHIFQVVTLI